MYICRLHWLQLNLLNLHIVKKNRVVETPQVKLLHYDSWEVEIMAFICEILQTISKNLSELTIQENCVLVENLGHDSKDKQQALTVKDDIQKSTLTPDYQLDQEIQQPLSSVSALNLRDTMTGKVWSCYWRNSTQYSRNKWVEDLPAGTQVSTGSWMVKDIGGENVDFHG